LTVALGTIIRVATLPEKCCIVGATKKKTRIIMNYTIGHLFDSPIFENQLIFDRNTSVEGLKRERNKSRITFNRGGEVFILSAQVRTKQNAIDALTGFGTLTLF
jgi:hypothetical protein